MKPTLLTWFHTLRHLRPSQVYGRFLHRYYRPNVAFSPVPGRNPPHNAWIQSVERRPSLLGPQRVCFLSQEAEIDTATAWNDPRFEKLWLYNLHYFDDLTSHDACQREGWHRPLLERWVAENPPCQGVGWESYPTSLRMVNWIKWALAGHELPPPCLASLAIQARWLARRLEIHLLGNHLFVNGKALIFAGMFFHGQEASAWYHQGMALLEREVEEQILADGGQFERSPMYHLLAVEDMLDLCNLFKTYQHPLPQGWLDRIVSMHHWMWTMTHPDGEIGFFNDAAMEIAPLPLAFQEYGQRLGVLTPPLVKEKVVSLMPSGYVRLDQHPLVALLDVAPVGPDYLPGHAHADTLSCEVSLFGHRVLVNSGTSCYGLGAERLRQRGTAAHNTVVVDGENSSEVWGGFRVGRRARPRNLVILHQEEEEVVEASHDGYHRLAGKPVHQRRWTLRQGGLDILDTLHGKFATACARYHLHPLIGISSLAPQHWRLTLPDQKQIQLTVEGGEAFLEPATWHPKFGSALDNQCLVVPFASHQVKIHLNWSSP